jgi:hypothetical protein
VLNVKNLCLAPKIAQYCAILRISVENFQLDEEKNRRLKKEAAVWKNGGGTALRAVLFDGGGTALRAVLFDVDRTLLHWYFL